MGVSRNLHRLLEFRDAQQRQSRTRLEMAVSELRRLQTFLENVRQRGLQGKALVVTAIEIGEAAGRIAGLAEVAAAEQLGSLVMKQIRGAEKTVSLLRAEFMERRVARRQAETLLDAMKAEEALKTTRKSQAALDEWHRARRDAEEKSSLRPGKRDVDVPSPEGNKG